MTDHLSAETLRQYQQRVLSAEALLSADDHLANCPRCQNQLELSVQTVAAVTALRTDFAATRAAAAHLSFEQLTGWLEQTLDTAERKQAAAHLQDCTACADELADLQDFAEQVAEQVNASTALPTAEPVKRGLSDWLGLAGNPLGAFAWLKLGVLTAGLLLASVGVWRWWRVAQTPAPFVATINPTPSPVASPAALPYATPNTGLAFPRLAFKEGKAELRLNGDGLLTGSNFVSAADEKRVQSAWQAGKLETPALLNQLRGNPDQLMGGGNTATFRLLAPVGTIVLSDRPVLRWQALPEAASYVVTVADSTTNFVLTSDALTTNRWTPARPLPRGRSYTWQVVAQRAGQAFKAPANEAPEARFHIVEQTAVNELARVKRAYAGQRLLLGLTYARFGLLAEAEAELKALAQTNPQAEAVHKLWQAVQAQRKTRN